MSKCLRIRLYCVKKFYVTVRDHLSDRNESIKIFDLQLETKHCDHTVGTLLSSIKDVDSDGTSRDQSEINRKDYSISTRVIAE